MVRLFINNEFIGFHRALGDTGAHPNIIAYKIVKGDYSNSAAIHGSMIGIENQSFQVKRKITIGLQPWYEQGSENRINVSFWILPKSVKWNPVLPERNIACSEIPNGLSPVLADPLFWRASPVSVLLNVGTWASLLNGQGEKINENLLSQGSKFGNVISGQLGQIEQSELKENKYVHLIQDKSFEELNKSIQRFWAFDDLSLCTKKEAEEDLVEQIFQQNHNRDKNGRFSVAIPLNPNVEELGSSREIALKRFLMLERRFEKDPNFKQKYVEFMREYELLGHMERVADNPEPNELVYHIPHHGVVTSDKFRVVFDASCKTNKGISLNDAQLVGEKLQRDLHEQIMRFRRHRIGIQTDVKKMFRQVEIIPKQRNLQRIFWRENANEPLREYCLKTVTYESYD